MNFTSDVKRELISQKREFTGDAAKAALSAFIRTSGQLGVVDGVPNFFIVSETENVAEFFSALFFETFGRELAVTVASVDKMSGRGKLVLQCPPLFAEEALTALGLWNAKKRAIEEGLGGAVFSEETGLAYIKGAFLGGGSCMLPSDDGRSGYHLEFVFSDPRSAEGFCDLLEEYEILAKLVERKEAQVAYVKSKETISDFLAAIGAERCLKKFVAVMEKRDEANRSNRAANCMSGNADKTALAAVKQVVAIKKLFEAGALQDLSPDLKELAKLRLKEPTKSLKELADQLGVGKSCLNHRMRKLLELAERIEEK